MIQYAVEAGKESVLCGRQSVGRQLITKPLYARTVHWEGACDQMRLILIRHGESDHALRSVIAGRGSCRGLSERGFQQAELLAHRFGATGEVSDCQALLCSPGLRARRPAEVFAVT